MAPRLRILAGTSPTTLVPITHLVNTSTPHKLSSDVFEGEIVTNIKGLTDEGGKMKSSEYFEREDRRGVTWSLQVQGRFLVPYSSDDILFGNTFDRPLKLPWGTGAVLKFMNYIDPTLEQDLASQTKPWALSPFISTMPHFAHRRIEPEGKPPVFPPKGSLVEYTGDLHLALRAGKDHPPSSASSSSEEGEEGGASPASSSSSIASSGSAKSRESTKSSRSAKMKQALTRRRKDKAATAALVEDEVKHLEDASRRRALFADEKKRKAVVFGPQDVLAADFCYGFMSFEQGLALQLPGGVSFDLGKYWDGQPVRFVCCERGKGGGEPWGRVFWCVAIEMAEET